MLTVRLLLLTSGLLLLVVAAPAQAGHMYANVGVAQGRFQSPFYDTDFLQGDDLPISISAEYSSDPFSGNAAATSDYNDIGVNAFATGQGGPTPLEAYAVAEYTDLVRAYDANGNEITDGRAVGFFHFDGTLSGNVRVSFGFEFGDSNGGQDGAGRQYGTLNTDSPFQSVDESLPFDVQLTANGMSLYMGLNLTTRTNSFAATGMADFSSTGTLASIVYVDPNGIVDPTVQFRGVSGNIYPTPNPQQVPEPASLVLMGMGLAGSCVFARRKRRLAA